jgi:hypothetical protein
MTFAWHAKRNMHSACACALSLSARLQSYALHTCALWKWSCYNSRWFWCNGSLRNIIPILWSCWRSSNTSPIGQHVDKLRQSSLLPAKCSIEVVASWLIFCLLYSPKMGSETGSIGKVHPSQRPTSATSAIGAWPVYYGSTHHPTCSLWEKSTKIGTKKHKNKHSLSVLCALT